MRGNTANGYKPIMVCYEDERGFGTFYDACEVCASECRRDESGELRLDLNLSYTERD